MKRSESYEIGRSGRVERNPYDPNSTDFDDFEAGMSQYIKSSGDEHWRFLEDSVDVEYIAKEENSYAKAKGK